MTVIVMASHKGGVGKTTIGILLAEEFARMGHDVAAVESDNQRHIQNYLVGRRGLSRKENFRLYTDEDPDTLGSTIKKADATHDIVIVDLPGFDGLEFTRAVARANLVLIPMSPSAMDNNSAMDAIRKIAIEEEHLDRKVHHRIILNMIKDASRGGEAIAVGRTEKGLRHLIATGEYPRMASELSRREGPFKGFYSFAQTLVEMAEEDGNSSVVNAYTEVRLLAEETIAFLRNPTGTGRDFSHE